MINPPKLKNDCFALPPGVDWVPVDQALARLQSRVEPVVSEETLPVSDALGRILSQDVKAVRANPPAGNSAVDGYCFRGPIPEGRVELALLQGRAAAGVPYEGEVPEGHALRILTGAIVPSGVDTVVLQEDTALEGGKVAFHGPLKQGANTRLAGEDVVEDETIFSSGRKICPQDIALLVATGVHEVAVYRKLRVGVLSNGDEVVAITDRAPEQMGPGAIYDANRPMLLSLLSQWGYDAVDLGCAPDDRDGLRQHLNDAATRVDAILSSGGVSAGDEDHVSALLSEEGTLETWRIAIKPGRPLALALWNGVPVFGLPGNPVAAFVCTLVFGRPALGCLSGERWSVPGGFMVPAGFRKTKKNGRQEFLRARMSEQGQVEVFSSEGSGRISGLSWAEGLVQLPEQALTISPGDPVKFIPFASYS